MLGAFTRVFTSLVKTRAPAVRFSSSLHAFRGSELPLRCMEPLMLLRPLAPVEPAPTPVEEMLADSVMRKRRLKMKKHKLRKRRKRQKAEKRKQSQGK
ncbi:LAQU0S08e01178g1_1 [Lachancea quebecensis]|uniref:LAQU0S08e01178g1_1 n=1 Tax=Lachancea quebecensis TaxID=1654605 RepID=A0A0N7MLR9_9SACH|nr:LAQU0S08e01178g1_1 [Lachancea quebecensis]